MTDDNDTTTVELRETNPDESDKKAEYESPEGEAVCTSYVDRSIAEQLGEYATMTISDEAEVNANLSNISGSGSGNYAVFETPGGAVVGLYISHDTWSEALGREVERDDENNVTNAPDSIGLAFAPSDEEAFEEATAVPEEEAEGLLADSDDSDDEEEVEIEDEELGLVDAE